MRRGKKMLALLLAFTMVFQLLPTSVLSLTTQQIDLSPIVYEGFEVGESFAMNNDPTEEIVMNKAYYGDYAQSGPYAAAWTNAHPVADSYVEAYWDSSAKYGSIAFNATSPCSFPPTFRTMLSSAIRVL